MYTASEQNISRTTLFVSIISLFILIVFFYSFNDREHVSLTENIPVLQINLDLQEIIDEETNMINDQQQIAEIGWALILYTENLSPYGIPQILYHVQLLDDTVNDVEYLQLNVFAPSNLLEDDLMVRLSQSSDTRKEIFILRHETHESPEITTSLYFVKRKTSKEIDQIDEG